MSRMLSVAWREFKATVFTKGFIIGIVMMPVMLGVVIGVISLMKGLKGPEIEGEIAIIDRTGIVSPFAEKRFGDEAERAERKEQAEEVEKVIDEKLGPQGKALMDSNAKGAMKAAVEQMGGAKLTLKVLPVDADAEKEKGPVMDAKIVRTKDKQAADTINRLALVVLNPGTVNAKDGKYDSFEIYYAPRLDFEIQGKVMKRISDAVVDARVTSDQRFQAGKLTPADVRAVVGRPEAKAITVSREGGEKKSRGEIAMFIPMAFMLLLMMSTMISTQSLLTSTVEEKSSRVMEVLLSAVSPMQLMVGKIIGQLGVGLIILTLYSGLGIFGLIAAAMNDLITPLQISCLLIFFLLAYGTIACAMAAIGSVVNDMREAQTLLGPIMTVIMLPWMMWFFIQRAPNSTLATALSFTPVINSWIMVLRVSGSEPVPPWQIPASIFVSIVTLIFMAWAAAKIFRIGVLMYGKPPNFTTLVRWVRMS